MIVAGFLALGLALAALAVLLRRARAETHRVRADLTNAAGDLRAERDAAIRAVRWVPLKDDELFALAKTGCSTCHGAGKYMHGKGIEAKKAVCQCVIRRIANNAKYAAIGDGTPVRIATQAELDAILPTETNENVIPMRVTA